MSTKGVFLSLSLLTRQAAAFASNSTPAIIPANVTISSTNSTNTTINGTANPQPKLINPTPIPLVVTNSCGETIWPGIATQNGMGPRTGGFELAPGATRKMGVSPDWQGRVWGRTNCSFNSDGTGPGNLHGVNGNGAACLTGDCSGTLDCKFSVSCPRPIHPK
jgi:hypothetical protein